MLQVKSRYNERHKNKNITITPSSLLIVCQREDRVTTYWKTLLLLIPRALWHWHLCLTLTQQSISRNLGVPNGCGAPLFIVSVPPKHKENPDASCCGWCEQASTVLCCTRQTCSVPYLVPESWLVVHALDWGNWPFVNQETRRG